MKLKTLNPSWLTKLTCSLNPNQVLQTAHLNRTNPGPTPQSRLQNTRGKTIGLGERPVPSPKTIGSLKSKSRNLDPQRLPQSGSPTGAGNDTPPQDEPQSYPTAQISEYLPRDSVTNEQCIPIFSVVTLKKKKKMLFVPMDFQDLTLDALIDSGALVNCISETDYYKIIQMSRKDIVKELEPPLQTPSRKRRYRIPHKDNHSPIRDRTLKLWGNFYCCKTTHNPNTRPHFPQEY